MDQQPIPSVVVISPPSRFMLEKLQQNAGSDEPIGSFSAVDWSLSTWIYSVVLVRQITKLIVFFVVVSQWFLKPTACLRLSLEDSCSQFMEIIFGSVQASGPLGNSNANRRRTCEKVMNLTQEEEDDVSCKAWMAVRFVSPVSHGGLVHELWHVWRPTKPTFSELTQLRDVFTKDSCNLLSPIDQSGAEPKPFVYCNTWLFPRLARFCYGFLQGSCWLVRLWRGVIGVDLTVSTKTALISWQVNFACRLDERVRMNGQARNDSSPQEGSNGSKKNIRAKKEGRTVFLPACFALSNADILTSQDRPHSIITQYSLISSPIKLPELVFK